MGVENIAGAAKAVSAGGELVQVRQGPEPEVSSSPPRRRREFPGLRDLARSAVLSPPPVGRGAAQEGSQSSPHPVRPARPSRTVSPPSSPRPPVRAAQAC